MKLGRLNHIGVAAILVASASFAQPLELAVQSPLEKIVLGEPEAAKAHLTALALRAREDRDGVISELLAAGFKPDQGRPPCAFYGYHRVTTQQGAARSVQIALCPSGEPMVLVLDFLPPDANRPTFQERPKGQEL
jgi:hypothetical protein